MSRLPELISADAGVYLETLNASIIDIQPVSGGSINSACLLHLSNQQSLFLKYSLDTNLVGAFKAEYVALSQILAAGKVRVPSPMYCTDKLLICEVFETGPKNAHWHESLGRQLAELHLATRQQQFGFDEDNFIGASPQLNGWYNSWPAFWREQRLGFQLKLFSENAASDDPLLSLGNKLMENLDKLLSVNEPAVLLHGDLWSGNAAADENGDPIIFDPAVYYGQREAEFGMMRLFGGFGPRTEAAYQEVWPFEAGYDERISVYRLYHELNHLNIFGHSYYAQCMETLRKLCKYF